MSGAMDTRHFEQLDCTVRWVRTNMDEAISAIRTGTADLPRGFIPRRDLTFREEDWAILHWIFATFNGHCRPGTLQFMLHLVPHIFLFATDRK